jgi:hypothetical protein
MEQLDTLEEVAAAWKVSKWQVGEWAREGEIRGAKKVGRFWRFTKDAEWIGPQPQKRMRPAELSWDDVLGTSASRRPTPPLGRPVKKAQRRRPRRDQ